MIRSFEVEPSAQIELDGRMYDVVTEADLAAALARLAVLITYAGGCGFVMPQRIPTKTPNEFVTIRAIVTWQDRSNAKPRPEENALDLLGEPAAVAAEPEQQATVAGQGGAEPAPAESVLPFEAPETPVAAQPAQQPPAPTSSAAAAELDGLMVDPDAVDESDLPAALRSS